MSRRRIAAMLSFVSIASTVILTTSSPESHASTIGYAWTGIEGSTNYYGYFTYNTDARINTTQTFDGSHNLIHEHGTVDANGSFVWNNGVSTTRNGLQSSAPITFRDPRRDEGPDSAGDGLEFRSGGSFKFIHFAGSYSTYSGLNLETVRPTNFSLSHPFSTFAPAGPSGGRITAVKEITVKDVFNNKKSLPEPTVLGHEIIASFTPHVNVGGFDIPIDLSDLAKLAGVHHFNWKQVITLPGFDVLVDQDGNPFTDGDNDYTSDSDREQINQPVIDIIPYPNSRYVVTNPDAEFVNINGVGLRQDVSIISNPGVPDFLPYYYNDGGGLGFSVANMTFATELDFYDAPRLRQTVNPHGIDLEFRTELVGVYADGSAYDTGIGFRWRSNAVHAGGSTVGRAEFDGFLGVAPGDVLPPVVAGGITNVEVFGVVPEPSSLMLALVALLLPVRRLHHAASNHR